MFSFTSYIKNIYYATLLCLSGVTLLNFIYCISSLQSTRNYFETTYHFSVRIDIILLRFFYQLDQIFKSLLFYILTHVNNWNYDSDWVITLSVWAGTEPGNVDLFCILQGWLLRLPSFILIARLCVFINYMHNLLVRLIWCKKHYWTKFVACHNLQSLLET